MGYTTFNLKSCPKCNGDMAEDQDLFGPYWTCLQCGHVDEGPPPSVRQVISSGLAQALMRMAP